MNVVYSEKAIDDLKKLPKETSKRIVKKISFYTNQKDPLDFAKKITDPTLGQFRFRIGDYRAIFDVTKGGKISMLYVLTVKHRKEVYSI